MKAGGQDQWVPGGSGRVFAGHAPSPQQQPQDAVLTPGPSAQAGSVLPSPPPSSPARQE